MFIRSVEEVLGTDRDAAGDGWKSRRLILARDGLTYSVHETVIAANKTLRFLYHDHRETVYCITGEAIVTNLATGETREMKPGTLYSVNSGDDHQVVTKTVVKFLCIFDPPLVAREEAT